MRYQVTLGLEVASTEEAIAAMESWALSAGTILLSVLPVPEPVVFDGIPQTVEDDGGSLGGIEEMPAPSTPAPNGGAR